MSAAHIVIDRVTKRFGDTPVLRDVSLRIAPGQVSCVIGPSGSGKSTLLRCLNALETPDLGTIVIGGQRVGADPQDDGLAWTEAQAARFRAKVGMVFQQFNLFPHMTVLENVVEAPRRVLRRDARTATDQATALLERVGLASKRDEYPKRLSGGQQQRVAIARALAMEPEVMLFDEATSALDPELGEEVLAVMRDLARGGMTMVVVTHVMRFAQEVADQVVMLDHGRVIEDGSSQQVFTAPRAERTAEFLRTYRQ